MTRWTVLTIEFYVVLAAPLLAVIGAAWSYLTAASSESPHSAF